LSAYWPILALVGIVLVFIPLIRWSNKKSAEGHKVVVANFEALNKALNEAFAKAIKSGNADAKVIEMLIEASTHLAAPPSWTSTRAVIGQGAWVRRYQDGLALVKEAEKLIGA
ncbi:MAG: hypothetical protein K2Z81_17420, partial [Cyanobacteria bacterium]|nr:hypothetical protein [Cyanobacteriota bacterium]